ncbi:MAG: D-alanyl-D-alanine carboxypeptidase [Clostridia bacterium]|nr:D-alanyl-D-alanine carboxypeptidase [Clostridia bacterium]
MKKLVILFAVLLIAVTVQSFDFSQGKVQASIYSICSESESVVQTVASTDTSSALLSHAKSGLLISDNGQVLYEKDMHARRPIASMVKIMTLTLIFEAIEEGKLSLDDLVTASENASSMGGSQAFLDANGTYKADALIKSIVVASANDSCVAMAEHLCGSVTLFVERMNEKALELKMKDTNFANCTGLPDSTQYSSAYDAALMTIELCKHKKFFDYSKIWMEDMVHNDGRITTLTNTNKLVRFYQGCEGGKTGYTAEAGHCVSAIAGRNNMRLIAVVLGGEDSKSRFADASGLLNYGFGAFENKTMLSCGQAVGSAKVKNGKIETVEVIADGVLNLFGERGKLNGETKVEYEATVKAPVKKGDVLGKAYLVSNGKTIASLDLVAASDVSKLSIWDSIRKAVTGK